MIIDQDTIEIATMSRADVPAVMEIERKSYTCPWHENAYLTELSNSSATYIVARINGEAVGYAGMWVVMDEAHITTLAVDISLRGKKIGERLLLSLIERAVHQGAERASLEVREHNIIAQNLYSKYGFHSAALRKAYYTDNYENAVVMWVDRMRDENYRNLLATRREELMTTNHDCTGTGNKL